jgi:hypothetical protein
MNNLVRVEFNKSFHREVMKKAIKVKKINENKWIASFHGERFAEVTKINGLYDVHIRGTAKTFYTLRAALREVRNSVT